MNWSLPHGHLYSALTRIFGCTENPVSCWSQTSQSCGCLKPPGCAEPSRWWTLETDYRNHLRRWPCSTERAVNRPKQFSNLLWSPDTCQTTTWTPLPGLAPSPAPRFLSTLCGPVVGEKVKEHYLDISRKNTKPLCCKNTFTTYLNMSRNVGNVKRKKEKKTTWQHSKNIITISIWVKMFLWNFLHVSLYFCNGEINTCFCIRQV